MAKERHTVTLPAVIRDYFYAIAEREKISLAAAEELVVGTHPEFIWHLQMLTEDATYAAKHRRRVKAGRERAAARS